MVLGGIAHLAGAACVIGGVLSVSVFAQSVTPEPGATITPEGNTTSYGSRSRDDDRTGMGVARLFEADAHEAVVGIPSNLIVPGPFRVIVDEMLRTSPTFRRQCRRIEQATRMTVALEWFHPPATMHLRARTIVSTEPDGRRRARVEIRPIDDPVELIAHEIEHVIEQLDDVDLDNLAAVPESGVRGCNCREQTFETTRAIRAGLAASAEVRRNRT
jgi:hypothetical protein